MPGPALPPSFSRVSRGFEDHVSEPANAQLDAASWEGRGVCEADGVFTWVPLAPTTPPAHGHPSYDLPGSPTTPSPSAPPLLGQEGRRQEGNSFCLPLVGFAPRSSAFIC